MELKLYNTLSRQIEVFSPRKKEEVGLYVCGPTVYDSAHIGNARPVVVFDILFRVLKTLYPRVTYVRNITDVDDKINEAARHQGVPIHLITQKTIAAYHEDMALLGTLSPTYEPKATDYIPQMITLIQTLMEKGHAYEAEGHVLFSVKSFSAYGHLSRCSVQDRLAGARVEIAPFKKDAADFVLWKPSAADLPGWDSPWGRGRPGWHIECSAMSFSYLGETFDIHGGGQDLIFPHHENEIAQSCCAHGTSSLATYWIHNGWVTVEGEKMSKSLGNFITVRQLLSQAPGETIRYALMSSHYRQPLDWTASLLSQSKAALDRLYGAWRHGLSYLKEFSFSDQKTPSKILGCLLEDLNVPLALSALHEVARQIYKTTDPAVLEPLLQELGQGATLLGLFHDSPQAWFQKGAASEGEEGWSDAQIQQILDERQEARRQKDFARADTLRKQLEDAGILVEDSPQGPRWRR